MTFRDSETNSCGWLDGTVMRQESIVIYLLGISLDNWFRLNIYSVRCATINSWTATCWTTRDESCRSFICIFSKWKPNLNAECTVFDVQRSTFWQFWVGQVETFIQYSVASISSASRVHCRQNTLLSSPWLRTMMLRNLLICALPCFRSCRSCRSCRSVV